MGSVVVWSRRMRFMSRRRVGAARGCVSGVSPGLVWSDTWLGRFVGALEAGRMLSRVGSFHWRQTAPSFSVGDAPRYPRDLDMHALQAIGTPQVVEAVAEAACAKPLEMQLPMFEVRHVLAFFACSMSACEHSVHGDRMHHHGVDRKARDDAVPWETKTRATTGNPASALLRRFLSAVGVVWPAVLADYVSVAHSQSRLDRLASVQVSHSEYCTCVPSCVGCCIATNATTTTTKRLCTGPGGPPVHEAAPPAGGGGPEERRGGGRQMPETAAGPRGLRGLRTRCWSRPARSCPRGRARTAAALWWRHSRQSRAPAAGCARC